MGSVASYSAEVVVRYKRDIKLKTPNTDKDIEDFLKLKGAFYRKEVCPYQYISKANIKGDIKGFEFSIKEDIYNSLEDIEDFFKYHTYYYKEFYENIYKIVEMDKESLRFIDLNIAKEYKYLPQCVDKFICLGNISGEIYAEPFNPSHMTVDIPQTILEDYINKKCTLEVFGDGSTDY